MERKIRRIFILFRSMGYMAVLPVFLLWAVFPYFTITAINHAGKETADYVIAVFPQCTVTIISVWWIGLLLGNFLDDSGNELFYLNRKSKGKEIFSFVVLYLAAMMGYYLVINHWYPVEWTEIIRIIIEVLWFCSCFYFFAYLLGTVVWALAVILLYFFASLMFLPQKYWFVFFSGKEFGWELFACKYLVMFIMSACIWCFAGFINNRYEDYH